MRAVLLLLQALAGLAIVWTVFPFVDTARQRRIANRFLRLTLAICGVTVRAQGAPLAPGRGALVVSNHVSWLDILVLNHVGSIAFVSKSEVRDWPVIGTLAARSGTIFIERGRRRAVHDVIERIAQGLREQQAIVVFAEGTTTDGSSVLPFHSNLLQAALLAGAPLWPVCIAYRRHGKPSEVPAYFGDMTLATSAWRVLSASGLSVDVQLLDRIDAELHEDRHSLARRARQAIQRAHDRIAA